MDAITYTQARKNFAKAMNAVCEDHAPLIITRQNKKPVVMMSLEDYSAIEETLYLLRSPGVNYHPNEATDNHLNEANLNA